MARPNVTVIIDDQSFFVPGTESGSLVRAGMPSTQGLIMAVGNTAERKAGQLTTDSVIDWIGRLNSTDPVSGTAQSGSFGHPFSGVSGAGNSGNGFAGGTASRWYAGPTGSWKNEWWAAHNYLQYGGVLIVAATGEDSTSTSGVTRLQDKQIALDVVFAATGGTDVSTISTTRGDCISVLNASGAVGAPSSATRYGTADEFSFNIWGQKKHLDINRTTNSTDGVVDYITTNCSADVAGCIARNDKLGDPWWSPAGFKRGQILDVVSMVQNPSDSEMDDLYDAKINPVVTFPGEGTVLFGDKTGAGASSTLSRINVSRLFIFLKKTIGAAARDKLFEFNDEVTRASFINAVVPVLNTVKSRRGLYDYRVVCDESNNTSDIIDSNQFVADVFLKPAKSINFIRLRFTNKSTADNLE